MDGDPAVEPEAEIFSLILPLPYRVAIILVLGIWAWAVNLHYLSIVNIDVASLIRYSNRTASNAPSYHHRTYRLAALITIPLFGSLLIFWTITHGQSSLVNAWEILPISYLCFLAIIFVIPLQRLSKGGRYRFLSTLKRISIGGIAESQDGKFGDILLADVLTSYAKVLGDLFVTGCMLLSSKYSSTAKPDRGCGGAVLVPLILSVPSLIRLRQCSIEFLRVRRSRRQSGSYGSSRWGGQHLANAVKYFSALPVIILSALQRGYNSHSIGISETALFRLWIFFVLLNSFYSFYWDVAKDWDLTIFASSEERNDPEHSWGLRRHTRFQAKEIYYSAIAIDFVLRCTWSLKLSTHLDHFNDLEGGIFVIEVLEVLRRWMWIFFRVETEWIRTSRRPIMDDIPLGEYHDDYDKLDLD